VKPKKKIAIFIAYKAADTLEKFYKSFPKSLFDEIILVDDCSPDETFAIAKKLKGLKAYRNKVNLGYGGNLKKAVCLALSHGADIIVDIHPDGEYKPSAIPPALEKITKEKCDFVMGNRFTSVESQLKSGMFAWKILPLLALSFIDRLVLGVKITDFHQGFRVYSRKLFEKVNFEKNSNNYLFSFELITQAVFHKIKIAEVPVETNYEGKKRGASLKNSIKYTSGTFKILGLYLLAKLGVRIELFEKPKTDLEKRISPLLN